MTDRTAKTLTCKREIGRWTVRVGGVFLISFWRKGCAFEFVHRLTKILGGDND